MPKRPKFADPLYDAALKQIGRRALCDCGEPDTCTSGLSHSGPSERLAAAKRRRVPTPDEVVQVKFAVIGDSGGDMWLRARAAWIGANSFKWYLIDAAPAELSVTTEGEALHDDFGTSWRFVSS